MIEEKSIKELVPIIREVLVGGGTFTLFPRGTSMLPIIRAEKDSVVLSLPENLKKNDIVLYGRTNGTYVLHRIVRIKNGEYFMCGDNQFAIEHGIFKDSIIAKVTEIISDDGENAMAKSSYNKYVGTLKLRRLCKRIRAKARRIIKGK